MSRAIDWVRRETAVGQLFRVKEAVRIEVLDVDEATAAKSRRPIGEPNESGDRPACSTLSASQ